MSSLSLRLDKWLFFARVCKTRAYAQKIIERGQITLNGAQIRKSSVSVKLEDKLVIVLGPVKRSIIVRQLGARRGPASEARALFDEPQPPERLDRHEQGLPRHVPLLTRPKGLGRPTKKDRRAIDTLLQHK
jgi:ribosome-associated heat shock protein Hsp15